MTKEQVQRALRFYEGSPDGQYDLDVVVPILQEWLARAAAEPDWFDSTGKRHRYKCGLNPDPTAIKHMVSHCTCPSLGPTVFNCPNDVELGVFNDKPTRIARAGIEVVEPVKFRFACEGPDCGRSFGITWDPRVKIMGATCVCGHYTPFRDAVRTSDG